MIALHVSYAFGLPNDGRTHLIATFAFAILAGLGVYLILSLFASLPLNGRPAGVRWFNIWQLGMGADGRPSSSKAQVVLWGIVVFFAYVVVFVAQTIHGVRNPAIPVPGYLLALAGLSLGTAAAAKVITTQAVNSGAVTTKSPQQQQAPSPTAGGLLTDDAGQTDIGKFQLMSWTVVTAGIFLVALYENVAQYFGVITPLSSSLAFPSIDSTLLAILGVNQGVYVASKLSIPGASPAGQPASAAAATVSAPADSSTADLASTVAGLAERLAKLEPAVADIGNRLAPPPVPADTATGG